MSLCQKVFNDLPVSGDLIGKFGLDLGKLNRDWSARRRLSPANAPNTLLKETPGLACSHA